MPHIPRPIARIPDVRFPAVPFCWRWLPPVPADWERARANRWGPVTDPQLIAFGVLVGWCRYRCSICGTSDPDYRLVMDHDHKTGLCRGLLCIDCNRTEGFAAGGVWALYRACPPALICGVKVYYWPASVLPAAPELLEFAEDLMHSKWIRRTWAMRTRQPWSSDANQGWRVRMAHVLRIHLLCERSSANSSSSGAAGSTEAGQYYTRVPQMSAGGQAR